MKEFDFFLPSFINFVKDERLIYRLLANMEISVIAVAALEECLVIDFELLRNPLD